MSQSMKSVISTFESSRLRCHERRWPFGIRSSCSNYPKSPWTVEVGFSSSGRQDALVGRVKSCKTFSTLIISSLHIGGDSYKPSTVASTDDSLIRCLRTKVCNYDHQHVPLKGSKTPKSASIPSPCVKALCHHCFQKFATSSFQAWVAWSALRVQCMFHLLGRLWKQQLHHLQGELGMRNGEPSNRAT